MKKQNLENHIRFYPPHHFVFYPVTLILLGISIYFASTREDQRAIWIFIAALIALIIWVAFMLRQHYSLILQNRIVRLELRYRYFALTNQRLDSLESNLDDSQLFALRFAPDEELVDLIQRTISENLSGTQIKRSIKNWKGDYNRV